VRLIPLGQWFLTFRTNIITSFCQKVSRILELKFVLLFHFSVLSVVVVVIVVVIVIIIIIIITLLLEVRS